MPDLKLDIGEGQIMNAIAVALAESFSGEKRDALLRDIIRAHMSVKRNIYDKETLLSSVVGDKVRAMALQALEQEIEKSRPAIERTVREVLGSGFEDTICEQLKYGLSRRKISNIALTVSVEEEE